MFSMLVSKTPYLLVFRFLLLILTVLTTKYTSTAPLTTINTVRARWVRGLSPGLGLTARPPPTAPSSPAFPPRFPGAASAPGLLLPLLSAARGPAAAAGSRAAVGPGGGEGGAPGPACGAPESGVALAAGRSPSRVPPQPGSASSSRKVEARTRLEQQLQDGACIVPGPPSHHPGASGHFALVLEGTMGAAESQEGVTKPQVMEQRRREPEVRTSQQPLQLRRLCC